MSRAREIDHPRKNRVEGVLRTHPRSLCPYLSFLSQEREELKEQDSVKR